MRAYPVSTIRRSEVDPVPVKIRSRIEERRGGVESQSNDNDKGISGTVETN